MNIIELFYLLDLERDKILEFASEDYIRMEKKINFEKKINPEIDSKTSENLILALKEYKEECLFVLSNRILFNFFTHNDFSRNYFSDYNLTVSDERIQRFIALFLADDLVSFFSFKLSKNKYSSFEGLDLLLGQKKYFPEAVIYKMTLLVFSKIDFAVSQLASNQNVHSSIYYIEFKAFYELLSHFAGVELDQKVSHLLSLVIDFYNNNVNSLFFNSVIKSMSFYVGFNEDMNKILVQNKNAVSRSKVESLPEKAHPAFAVIVGIITALIPLLMSQCS